MTKNQKAILAASAAVLSWSTVAAAFKTALTYYSHYEMLTVAALTATVIFAIAITLQKKWNQFTTMTYRDWGALALLGLFSPTLYYLILFSAYEQLPAQVAQPINYCWPIFLVILLALVMHKPVRPRLYIGMALSFAGVAVISLGGGAIEGELSIFGLLLAFTSAVLWAVYWIANEHFKGDFDESAKLFGSFLFGSLYLLIGLAWVPASFISVEGALASVYVGAFEMGIPFLFFSIALKNATNVATVNQMCYIAPFLSLFFISVIVGEEILSSSYIGLSLIIFGVIFNQYLAYPGSRKITA
jgi:hypothetical protein